MTTSVTGALPPKKRERGIRYRPHFLRPAAVPFMVRTALIKCEDGAGDFAGFHCAEGFVDVAETAALCHHVVELQAALAVEFEVGRDVGAETVRAHPRGLHPALRPDRHP